jgi:hypothetical protein
MKKASLVIVLLWAAHAHAGLFHHVIKPAGKAIAGASVTASKAVAGESTKAAHASKSAAQSSTKAVKKAVV